MPLPTYTAQDFARQFERLLPRGRVWHRGIGLVQDADIEVLMPTWSRLHVRLNDLIAEIFPCTLNPPELLTEWEDTLGLPDPCIGPLDSLQQRIAAVCTKFTARGGQTIAYLIHIAELLGYPALIQQFAPFRCGINRAGQPLYGEEWAHAFALVVPPAVITFYFRAGVSTAGDPLRAWGDKTLECLINEYAPAHTVPIIRYDLTTSQWDAGASTWDGGASIWRDIP